MSNIKTEKRPNDKLTCDFCKKIYTRQNKKQHQRSKFCQSHQQMLNNMKEALLQESIPVHPIRDKIKRPYFDKNNNLIYLTQRQLHFYATLGSKKYQFVEA